MAISKQQSMRPAEIELIDATNQHESTLQTHAQSLETLDKSLTAETTDRKSADTALGTRIDNETQARTDADTELGTRIDNEAQARTDADTALGTRIDNEAKARTDADNELGTRIVGEAHTRTDADTELGTRIDNEAQARTDADTALGTRIDNEVQARTSSDANLQGQLSDIRDSVLLVPTLSKVEFDQFEDGRYGAIAFFGPNGNFVVVFAPSGILIWDKSQDKYIKQAHWSEGE